MDAGPRRHASGAGCGRRREDWSAGSEGVRAERQPACPGSIRGEASLGAQSQTVRLGLHLPERSVLPVQRIERPDRFGLSLR